MENQETKILKDDKWQVRCTPEQREFFKKFVDASGMTAPEAISRAFEAFKIQSSEHTESKKALFEFDSLINRLQNMMRSQLVATLEKQTQCEEEKINLEKEKSNYQAFYDGAELKIRKSFESEKRELEKFYDEKIQQIQKKSELDLKEKETQCIKLIEKNETLQSDLKKSEQEKTTLQKQYTESMRSYEIADERLMELRLKVKDLEEKLKNFESIKEKNTALEKEVTVLQVKLDSLAKEEAIKREYFEKDLRREFEMTRMQLKQGVSEHS